MKHPTHDRAAILLVEDDQAARETMERMLGMKFPGVAIHAAENGQQGLELFRRHRPSLVITDINMPVLNGIEMARAIRAEAPGTVVIAISAHSETTCRRDAEQSGVSEYIIKPVDRHQLFDVVGRAFHPASPVIPL
ncbi:response regulator [Geomonas sp. Red32]|uniref:response regulator n=1 Tax=Geomonas sp. Red32 TaxID=2912856 RepID=UPI00202CF94E|nr:response regulator [Geomonas sp. Red32]MCM0083766.1 response regulator [Geomonas sp. Red32]